MTRHSKGPSLKAPIVVRYNSRHDLVIAPDHSGVSIGRYRIHNGQTAAKASTKIVLTRGLLARIYKEFGGESDE